MASFSLQPTENAGVSVSVPGACPVGHYCPERTILSTSFPCPAGKYGPSTHYTSLDNCTDCPAGSYCEMPGLDVPTGGCWAGYFCTGGASSPTPRNDMVDPSNNMTFTGNDVCPVGYYCDNSTAYPVPCPIGTFSVSEEVRSVNGCEPCPPGRYCNAKGFTKVTSAPLCNPGYVCTGGATQPEPVDYIEGYPCPRGYYCPAGATVPLGCDIGTYNNRLAQANCTICPAGQMCHETNMTEPVDCQTGSYCPEGLPPQPCPQGTFNNNTGLKDSTECTYCSVGRYCQGVGNVEPTGLCTAGHYCQGGAKDSVPLTPNAIFPENGPCKVGHYCPEGTPSPVPCPAGMLRNVTGGAELGDCSPCDGGYYCSAPGLSQPTGKCSPGYYCPGYENITVADPPDRKCPAGYYCPEGSAQPIGCPAGTSQPDEGKDTCTDCPAGYYCESSLVPDPVDCPAYHYCPPATSIPISCPNGTFTTNETRRLKAVEECLPCPAGSYCRGGYISGDCSAGYFCLSGSEEYTPDATPPAADPITSPCVPNTVCAGPCPAGSYCEEGTTDPTPCPEHTLRNETGARSFNDCVPCPAGYWCHEGDPVPQECPMGHYCPTAVGPISCPRLHYRDQFGGSNVTDCFACVAGYWCNVTGMADYTVNPCPVAHYCPEASEPYLCPAGQMRSTPGAGSTAECPSCRAGYYCPNDTANTEGIPCDETFACPTGSALPSDCPGGRYCPPVTGDGIICPAGYFCPNATGSNPFECPFPTYCETGSNRTYLCPLGYMAIPHSDLRTSLGQSCSMCPAGTYGNHTERLMCEICPEGYYCPNGTGMGDSNPCPIGYYCPLGSGSPSPCPAGMYGKYTKATDFSDCLQCPENTYNVAQGQKACRPCGSSSTSALGQSKCTCTGKYRAFQTSDGACRCLSGYMYYDEADRNQTDTNSDKDCQPIVRERCAGSMIRLASTGICVYPSSYDCTASCGGVSGTLEENGRCACSSYVSPEATCPATCRQNSPKSSMSYDPTDGTLAVSVYDPTTGTTVTKNLNGVLMPQSSSLGTTGESMYVVSLRAEATTGVVMTDPNDVWGYLGDTSQTQAASVTGRRRLLQVVTVAPTTSNATEIPNPIICLEIGEVMVFQLTIDQNDRTKSHYPKYIKDHLFNTNPSFDYGDFSQLAYYITETNVTYNTFAYAFQEAGTYVLADAQNTAREIIITVQAAGAACSTDKHRIQPSSSTNIVSSGIKKNQEVNQAPDWGLIIGMLSFLAACVLMLVVAVIVWRPRDSGIYPMKHWKPKHRSLGAPPPVPNYMMHDDDHWPANVGGEGSLGPRPVGDGAEAGDVVGWKGEGGETLEDFNVRVLFDKLEDQNLHLASQLARHNEDLQAFYDRVNKQNDDLKGMLNDLDLSKLEEIERQRREAGDSGTGAEGAGHGGAGTNVVSTTINLGGRQFKFTGGTGREAELMLAVQQLLDKLNSGRIPISPDMLDGKTGLSKTSYQQGSVKVHGQSDLLRRQNAERLGAERDLLQSEREALERFVSDDDMKRKKIIEDMSNKLADKLQGDLTAAEVSKIMDAHQKELEDALRRHDDSRDRQADALKEKLAARRRKREEELLKKHTDEAERDGLPPPPKPVDNSADKVSAEHLLMQALASEQNAGETRTAEEADRSMADEQVAHMSEQLKEQLDNLNQQGMLTDEEKERILREQREAEERLARAHNARRDAQMAALKQRMSDRKKKRVAGLARKHEQEKMELSTRLLQEGHHEDLDRVLADLETRQKREVEAAEAEVDQEEAGHTHRVAKALNEERVKDVREAHKAIIEKMPEISSGIDSVLQQRILDQYRRDSEAMEEQLESGRQRQLHEAQAKLAARRARRLAETQRLSEEERAARFLEEQERQMRTVVAKKDTSDDLFKAPEIKYGESVEEKALKKEHTRVNSELKKRQKEEHDALASKLEAEARQEERALSTKCDESREKALREKKNKQAAELAARKDLSQDEVAALMASHEHELQLMAEKMDADRQRQMVALRDRMSDRRRRRMDDLRRKQEVALTKEVLTQEKEINDVRTVKAKEVENEAMKEGIKENGLEDSDKVVRAVQAERHAQELRDLDKQFAAEKKIMVDDALTQLAARYDRLRDGMNKRFEAELEALKNEGLSDEEYEQRRAALCNNQALELAELDRRHDNEKKDIRQGALTDWEVRYARAKLDLKERHYKEFSEALRDFNPQHQSAAQAEAAAAELDAVRQRLQQQNKEQDELLKKQRKEFEAEEARRAQVDLEAYNRDLEQQMEREKERQARNIEALNQRKEQMVKDKKAKLKAELERMQQAGSSEEEQQQIIAAHQRDLQTLVNKMDADKLRMQSSLQERLKKKRDEKLKQKQKLLDKNLEESRTELAEKQRSEADRFKADEVLTLKESVTIDHMVTAAPGSADLPVQSEGGAVVGGQTVDATPRGDGQAMPASYQMAAPLRDAELTALLMSSPLYQKMEQIKKSINSGAVKFGRKAGPGEGYLDARDAEWTSDDKLEPVDLNKVPGRTFVVYKFGCFVVDLVAAHCQHKPLTLLLAEKIPANTELANNAYRNSFHYDASNRILYVRAARLESVGQFVLVLVHTLAHIKAGDLRDDHNPDFALEFYRALSVVCDDLFFARYRHESAPARSLAASGAEDVDDAARALLAAMFGDAYNEEEKALVVQELLDTRILPATDGQGVAFSADRIKQRLDKYGQYAMSHKLRHHLGDVSDKMAAATTKGSDRSISRKLTQLIPQSTTGNTLLTRQLLPETSALSAMTGQALWQTFSNDVEGRRQQPPAKNPHPAHKQLLQSQVEELETRQDQLNADFSEQSRSLVTLGEQIRDLEQEVARQTDLASKAERKDGAKHSAALKETTAKLNAQRAARQQLELKKAATLEQLEVCESELGERAEHKAAKEEGVVPSGEPKEQPKKAKGKKK